MADTSLKNDLISRFDKMPPENQRRLLEFAKALVPSGVVGKSLLRFEGTIPPDDLKLMSKAIEDGCEKVDIGEW